jgi:hypothetical protein
VANWTTLVVSGLCCGWLANGAGIESLGGSKEQESVVSLWE